MSGERIGVTNGHFGSALLRQVIGELEQFVGVGRAQPVEPRINDNSHLRPVSVLRLHRLHASRTCQVYPFVRFHLPRAVVDNAFQTVDNKNTKG